MGTAASSESIARAAELLRAGKLVAFPTETVYGLGADATDDRAVAAMIGGIVAFEIPLDRLEGKWKLNQNRTAADRAGVIAALRDRTDSQATAIVRLMAALD